LQNLILKIIVTTSKKNVVIYIAFIMNKAVWNDKNLHKWSRAEVLPLDEKHHLSLLVCAADDAVGFWVAGLSCWDLSAVITNLLITSLNEFFLKLLVSLHDSRH